MDSILKEKIKIVYDKWIDINGQKQYLPNGTHPLVLGLIQEKLNENKDFHQSLTEVKNLVLGELFNFDHSNFWGYNSQLFASVDLDGIDEKSDHIYIWPIEMKGSVIPNKQLSLFYKQQVLYFLQDTLNEKLLNFFKNGTIKILLNLAHDPINDIISFRELEKYFSKLGIDPANIIFVPGNDCREDYLTINPNTKLKISPAPLLLTHQVSISISQYPVVTNLKYKSELVTENDLVYSHIRKCKFLCLNRTMKPHRYVLAYHAVKKNLIENNYYSFLNSFESDARSIKGSLAALLPLEASLDEYSRKIKNILPLHIDTHGLDEQQRCEMTWTNNKKELYLNSYINIVSETSFEKLKNPFISEKLWKPVINLQPFILVGNYQTLKFIKDLGFKTFSPFIDESYDDVFDPIERMKLILQEIDRINSLPVKKIHDWYHSIKDILIFNRNKLESLKDINPYEVVFEDIINTYRG
jgi:hypothetical protein